MGLNISLSFDDDPIPVEKRIEGIKPTCDGLFPHEVLVLSYAPLYTDKTKQYHRFWYYTYGIKDVSLIIDSLYDRGYICKGTIEESINLCTAAILRNQLKKEGLRLLVKRMILLINLLRTYQKMS